MDNKQMTQRLHTVFTFNWGHIFYQQVSKLLALYHVIRCPEAPEIKSLQIVCLTSVSPVPPHGCN